MSRDVELQCRCGKVHGWMRGVSPERVNRVVCYCDDCQAFAHHLERADLLDEKGGSDIVQVAPATVSFDRGSESITAVRLGPKGLYRWYAGCCKTPLGNTMTPALPFVGFVHEALLGAPDARSRDELFGPSRFSLLGKFAIGGPPPGSTKPSLGFLGRTVKLILGWKLGGRGKAHPFFGDDGQPRYPVSILSRAERDALRSLCGPNPTARTAGA